MRLLSTLVLMALSFALLASPCAAEGVPLLDGHEFHGKVTDVTAEGLTIERHLKSGGTVTMHLGADHIDPHWWYARRDAALGDDVQARLALAEWAVGHGLFRQAKAQFEKARKLDPKAASAFQETVVPGLRDGMAEDLVKSAQRTMYAGKLEDANKMLQAVLTRFGDTPAATEARALQPTLQHSMDLVLKDLAFWKSFSDNLAASNKADERRAVTSPIVALIRQGNNIMGNMPPMAAQADAVATTRQAALEYEKAAEKVALALKAHAGDEELVNRLNALGKQARAGLLQSHVTAGDVYVSTGNYQGALGVADQLEALQDGAVDAAALRDRTEQAQSWSEDGIVATRRWVGRRAGMGGAGRGR